MRDEPNRCEAELWDGDNETSCYCDLPVGHEGDHECACGARYPDSKRSPVGELRPPVGMEIGKTSIRSTETFPQDHTTNQE